MSLSELKRKLDHALNELAQSDIDLGGGHSIEIYRQHGNTCNLKLCNNIVAQLIFYAGTVKVYQAEDETFLHFPCCMTCSLSDDISVLQDVVPYELLARLEKYKPRRRILRRKANADHLSQRPA